MARMPTACASWRMVPDPVNRKMWRYAPVAKKMIGKCHSKVQTIRPLRDGVIADYEVTDALGAIDYAAQRPELAGLPIGLFGVSRGAGAALVAAARNAAVESVAGDSAFATDIMMQFYAHRWSTLVVPAWVYRLIPWWHTLLTLSLIRRISQRRRRVHYANVERWLRRLATRDVFLISGARDSYVLPEVTHKLAELVGPHCPEPWIVPQAKHNMARQQDLENYDRRLVEFFEKMPAAETHAASVLEPSTD